MSKNRISETNNKTILVEIWVDDYDEDDHISIGKRKIDSNHKVCYDAGEFLFSECAVNCDVWVCHSHEEIDHICEDSECETTEGEDCTCGECN